MGQQNPDPNGDSTNTEPYQGEHKTVGLDIDDALETISDDKEDDDE